MRTTRPKKMLIGAAALCVLAAPALTGRLQDKAAQTSSQSPTATDSAPPAYVPTMTFDVASVRESKVNLSGFTVGGGFKPPNSGNLALENNSFQNLIYWAYPGTDHKFDWQNMPKQLQMPTVFNVEAKTDAVTDDKLSKLPMEQVRLEQAHMVQVLLADRFSLKAHWETRDSTTYDLVVTNPKKLQTTGAPPSAEEVKAWGDRGVPPIHQTGCGRGPCEYIAHAATPAEIVEMLQEQFGAPITDKTGLAEKYYFDLRYMGLKPGGEGDDGKNPWPPLELAIQDQLGLKLVASHGPVRFLVIDHAEMPSEN